MGGPVAAYAKRNSWTRREGKRFIYEVGMLCNLVSAVCVFIAFCSPYWIQSWSRVHSGFKRIGLWEVCFAGMVLEFDPKQKSYHGCWWILAPEFKNIEPWLMPWWFIMTQVLFTFIFVAELVGTGLVIVLWINTGMTQRDEKPGARTKKENIVMLQTAVAATSIGMLVKCFTMLLFAVAFYLDRNWLPLPELNYMSWSFGLATVSCFFSIFATIAQLTYVMIFRQERREPPKDVNMSGYVAAPSVAETSFAQMSTGGGGGPGRVTGYGRGAGEKSMDMMSERSYRK